MSYFSEQNIGKISFLGSAFLVVALSCTLAGLHVVSHYQELKSDIQFMEEIFIKQQKDQLRTSVNEQIARIDVRQAAVVTEYKNVLKRRTYNILNLMESLHGQYKETKTREELETLLLNAVRPFRFRSGEGYVFIRSMEGVLQLYPPDPTLEGHTADYRSTPNRKKVIEGLTRIVREQREGFYEYQWPKPGGSKEELYQKISFVSYFEPFDWYVGMGSYLDSFQKQAQQNILDILNMSSAPSERNYYFVYGIHDFHGGDDFATMLLNPNRPDLVGKMISDSYRDVKGTAFRKEMLKGLRENGEAFVEYWYKKPGTEKISRKLSYFKRCSEWNWVLARGIYFDDLEKAIDWRKELLSKKMKQDLPSFFLLFIVALSCAIILAGLFSRGIKVLFQKYKEEQQSLQGELEQSRDKLEQRVQSRSAELEKTHSQLLHAEKLGAIGSFSATIAHEFNNPLTGVMNVLSRLRRKLKLKENDQQLVDMALNECKRIQKMIQDLQSFNRPSSGLKSLFDLQETIESILLLCKKELAQNHITVETHFCPVSITVEAIEDQIKQVFLNLIKNAMDAMPVKGGELTITMKEEGDVVTVAIQDNGSGITAEHRKKIFEPFFTTKTAVKGTGLGLSTSYGIIKSHGGDIAVHSEPGKGTMFILSLPFDKNS